MKALRDLLPITIISAFALTTLFLTYEKRPEVKPTPKLKQAQKVPEPDYYAFCIEHLKSYESFRPDPYLGASGKWLIGYGHSCQPDHKTINEKEADSLLRWDFDQKVDYVNRYYQDKILGDERKLYALALAFFNLRAASAKKIAEKGVNDSSYWKSFSGYRTKKGVYFRSSGLLERREFEVRMYFKK